MEEEEKVLGVIPNASLKTGFLRSALYTLVVTNKRLIAAQVRKELIRDEKLKRKQEAAAEGHGRFKQAFRSFLAGFTFADRYLTMNPENIVKESERNFYIMPEDILDVKLKEGMITEDEDGNTTQYPHSLYIRTKDNKKYQFSFSGDFIKIRQLLNRIGSV